MNERPRVWRRGEAIARAYLVRRGYRTLGRNARLGPARAGGELDLLMLAPDRRTLVLVEVKARVRRTERGPTPEASLTADKQRRLARLARRIASRRRYRGRPVRVDLVAIEFPHRAGPLGWLRRPRVRHHRDAVHA